MRESRLKFEWLLTVLVVLSVVGATWADDQFPPSWRGQDRTVRVEWDWWGLDGSGPRTLWKSEGDPNFEANPGGFDPCERAYAHISSNVSVFENAMGRSGVMEVHSGGYLSFGLPNHDDGAQKIVLVQVTWLTVLAAPMYFQIGSLPEEPNQIPWQWPRRIPAVVLDYVDHNDGWMTCQYGWALEPNPEYEGFTILFSQWLGDDYTAYIDQVVIDTVCPSDVKWSQRPVPHPNLPDTYVGWDEEAHNHQPRMVADDFLCDSNKPVVAIRWWGSLLGWDQNDVPVGELPDAFYITIWNDVPVDPNDPNTYSHPGQIVWENYCETYDVNFYGWEFDPNNPYDPCDPCDTMLAKFEFYQELDPCDYWYQNIFPMPPIEQIHWLGIMAIYDDNEPNCAWGWETREHLYNDDAVRFFGYPQPGTDYTADDFEPIEFQGESWDLSFELLTVKEPVSKPPVEHLKWSQPPIEIDPNADIPTYCGWDEPSFTRTELEIWFDCWDWPTQCHGDADKNWMVNMFDMQILMLAYDTNYPEPFYNPCADFTRDLSVDVADMNTLKKWYLTNPPADCPPYSIWFDCWNSGTQCHGDTDRDGYVDARDMNIFAPAFGTTYPNPMYNPCADFTRDLSVGIPDLQVIAKWFGEYPPGYCPVQQEVWQAVADDFRCLGSMPITSIHWWGSHVGWDACEPPPQEPNAWRIGFWSNVPAEPMAEPNYSYPENLLWQIKVPAYRVEVNNVGQDEFPDKPSDTCFQYYVQLEPDEWFRQDHYVTQDDVYWLSVSAVYPNDVIDIAYPWGWKTRPWHWMDDAARFTLVDEAGPGIVLDPWSVEPIEDPVFGESFDVAFKLDTDPCWIKWEQPFDSLRHWPHYEDELSMATEEADPEPNIIRLVADDWPCDDNAPVTAAAWWGSYIGYGYEACQGPPANRPTEPDYFWLTIWDDVPAGVDLQYSHPNEIIWKYRAYDYDEVLVGFDKHPHGEPNEPVFRYSVRLPEEDWFCQDEPNEVYWFSVVAVYDDVPDYNWGWTNHEHTYNDDAVTRYVDANGVWHWGELYDQTGTSEDMSFILFTEPDCFPKTDPKYNQWVLQGKPRAWCCKYQSLGDVTGDGASNIFDLFIFRNSYGKAWPNPGYDCRADLNHDGAVNIFDLFIFRSNYGTLFEANYSCPWKDDCGPHPCP